MATTPDLKPTPPPPGHLLVGNLFDLDTSPPLESLADLARQYGPIYQLQLPGRGSRVIVSGYKLVDELCEETRFDKMLGPGLNILGEGPVGRGLFTSETSDPNWHKAHNVLLPAFSLDAMRSYFPGMLDVAVQLMQKWERLNPEDTVDVPADMTRLTLDTIALCGFNYRFNSFYRDMPHPFVVAMLGTLEAAQAQSRELPIQRALNRKRVFIRVAGFILEIGDTATIQAKDREPLWKPRSAGSRQPSGHPLPAHERAAWLLVGI